MSNSLLPGIDWCCGAVRVSCMSCFSSETNCMKVHVLVLLLVHVVAMLLCCYDHVARLSLGESHGVGPH